MSGLPHDGQLIDNPGSDIMLSQFQFADWVPIRIMGFAEESDEGL
jgi:hypothetical protein